jgi:hypothetical protein
MNKTRYGYGGEQNFYQMNKDKKHVYVSNTLHRVIKVPLGRAKHTNNMYEVKTNNMNIREHKFTNYIQELESTIQTIHKTNSLILGNFMIFDSETGHHISSFQGYALEMDLQTPISKILEHRTDDDSDMKFKYDEIQRDGLYLFTQLFLDLMKLKSHGINLEDVKTCNLVYNQSINLIQYIDFDRVSYSGHTDLFLVATYYATSPVGLLLHHDTKTIPFGD